jgi:hypothetical protein
MKRELWLRLRNYHFDNLVPAHLTDRVRAAFAGRDASTQAFASKVARKLGWKLPFTLRAIHEYKKFVYLGVVSGRSVTPPKVIDQVWHEHLLFTRAYRDFCREVLGRDFDHNPELLNSTSQTDVFKAQYAETLALYFLEFNREPPEDIWGMPKFGSGLPQAKSQRSQAPRPAEPQTGTTDSGVYESEPLHTFFGGEGNSGSADAFEMSGGGGFSGAGSGDSWSDASDGSSSGSDGGSDGGGSGCSSSCGGGGD